MDLIPSAFLCNLRLSRSFSTVSVAWLQGDAHHWTHETYPMHKLRNTNIAEAGEGPEVKAHGNVFTFLNCTRNTCRAAGRPSDSNWRWWTYSSSTLDSARVPLEFPCLCFWFWKPIVCVNQILEICVILKAWLCWYWFYSVAMIQVNLVDPCFQMGMSQKGVPQKFFF